MLSRQSCSLSRRRHFGSFYYLVFVGYAAEIATLVPPRRHPFAPKASLALCRSPPVYIWGLLIILRIPRNRCPYTLYKMRRHQTAKPMALCPSQMTLQCYLVRLVPLLLICDAHSPNVLGLKRSAIDDGRSDLSEQQRMHFLCSGYVSISDYNLTYRPKA